MRIAWITLVCGGVVLSGAVGAQTSFAPSDNPDLVRCFDNCRSALELARKHARANRLGPLRDSTQQAVNFWHVAETYYRDWPVQDPSWKTDFDAISKRVMNAATNAASSRVSDAAKDLDAALAALEALRERNGVPDLTRSLESLSESLESVEKSLQSVSTKGFGPAQVAELEQSVGQAAQSWQSFRNTVLDTNALGLDPSKLGTLKQLASVQDTCLEVLKYALANKQLSQASAQIAESKKALDDLRENLAAMNASASAQAEGAPDSAATVETEKSQPRRPFPLFPLLRSR